jgi:hypothetical protein
MIAMLLTFAVLSADPVQQADPSRIWSGDDVRYINRPVPEFPMGARTSRGSVNLICTVTARGGFRDCVIESETPESNGFGRAAILSMHRGARIELRPDGPSEGDRMRVKIGFWNGR